MAIVKSNAYDEDNIKGTKRETLANDIWDAGHEAIKKHPEVRLMMSAAWTPRPDDWPVGVPHDDSHTALISGEQEVGVEDLEKFLLITLQQMLKLYRNVVARDPGLIDILSRGKKEDK